MEGSREIAKLLVPTDPGGADRGWDGTLSLHEWVWPSRYTPITPTLPSHTHIRKHCFLSEASMDQFLLYEGSCLLKTGPEGHQMGVKQRSMTSHRGGGLGHERRGLYILHMSWGVDIYGSSVLSQCKGCNESSFWTVSFPICVLRYCMSKCWKEVSEVVINGFSVLGFSEAVQSLTRLSMWLLMLEVKSGW